MRKDRLTLWEWVYIMLCFRKEQSNQMFYYAFVSGSNVLLSPFAYLEASRFFAKKQALLKKKRYLINLNAGGFPNLRFVRYPEALAILDGQLVLVKNQKQSLEKENQKRLDYIAQQIERFKAAGAEHHVQAYILKQAEMDIALAKKTDELIKKEEVLKTRKKRLILSVNARIGEALAQRLFRVRYYYNFAVENLVVGKGKNLRFDRKAYSGKLLQSLCKSNISDKAEENVPDPDVIPEPEKNKTVTKKIKPAAVSDAENTLAKTKNTPPAITKNDMEEVPLTQAENDRTYADSKGGNGL